MAKPEGTHNLHFRHLVPEHDSNSWHDNYYRGFFDPEKDMVSVVLKDGSVQIPGPLDRALRERFGYSFKYVIF